ncbi:hypothetical protein D3C84_761150 [compost metagenome]
MSPGTAELDQQLFVIVTLDQGCGIHQLWLATQQMQQYRQQAVTLTVDDDTQLQIKPLVARLFLDLGVPLFHWLQVEVKVIADIDQPVFCPQCRDPVLRKGKPGGIIRQGEHFAWTVQAAFTRSLSKTVFLQGLTQGFFGDGVALDTLGFRPGKNQHFRVSVRRRMAVVGKRQCRTVLWLVLPADVALAAG